MFLLLLYFRSGVVLAVWIEGLEGCESLSVEKRATEGNLNVRVVDWAGGKKLMMANGQPQGMPSFVVSSG